MTVIAVDGLSEEDFRRSIENRLREGKPAVALERIRRLLAVHVGPSGILPDRFMTIEAKDLVLRGWQALEPAIQRHDRPGRPITALSISFGWPGEDLPQPDAQGHLRPFIETGYFTDDAYPFSHSARDDLLDGYSFHGCTWAADYQAVDNALSLEGVDDLHGTLALLEARLLASEQPDPDEILAGSLGACLLSVLLYQAVGERIERDGLPRPLCIMAGSNGVYPYFDAPVAGFPEEARKAAESEEEEIEVSTAIPVPRYSSLLLTGVPRGTKRAVLVLQESEEEMAARFAHLRDQSHIDADPGTPQPELPPESTEPALPEPEIAELATSPLLAKKQPGKAWDFRDMLSPAGPDSPQADREEINWDDWSDAPSSVGEEAETLDSGPIDWAKPFDASPLGFEPPKVAPLQAEPTPTEPPTIEPEPAGWDMPVETPVPDAGFAATDPVDWPEPLLPPAEEEAQALDGEPIDWSEPSEALLSEGEEAPALEQEPVDWAEQFDAPPLGLEPPAVVPESAERDELPEAPPLPIEAEVQAPEASPIDWSAPSETLPPPAFQHEPIDWGEPAEASEPVADSAPSESADWPDHLARPGFSLLEPSSEASVTVAYAPLPPLELTEPEPDPEPEPAAVDPRDRPIPDWPFGLGWLEDHEEAACAEAPLRPGLWARLRAWIGR